MCGLGIARSLFRVKGTVMCGLGIARSPFRGKGTGKCGLGFTPSPFRERAGVRVKQPAPLKPRHPSSSAPPAVYPYLSHAACRSPSVSAVR